MEYKKYTPFWRIMVLAAIISVLARTTLTDWGSWAAIIAAAVVVSILFFGVLKWLVKQCRKHTLFKPAYQDSEIVIAFLHKVDASEKVQRVRVTLRMAFETHVEFVVILFGGKGTLPSIKGLDDYQWGQGSGAIPPWVFVNRLVGDPEDKWFWRYHMKPEHRDKSTRITIGIDFQATDYFDGYLEFQMRTIDASKVQRLPFQVIKRANGVGVQSE